MVIRKMKNKKTILTIFKDISLMLGMFFLPFGFDIVQYYLISLTGNIWRANLSLYVISGFFFSLHLIFKKINKDV
jgi:hypothetical protein